MSEQIKKEWIQMKILLEPQDYHRVGDAAHAARLPTSVFVREILLGRIPEVTPASHDELSQEAKKLLSICARLTSNLTQIEVHARAAGEPLSRLSGSGGVLFKLKSKAMEIGLQAKGGQLVDQQEMSRLIAFVEGPAFALNEQLARPLNESKNPGLGVWRTVLHSLQSALAEEKTGSTNG